MCQTTNNLKIIYLYFLDYFLKFLKINGLKTENTNCRGGKKINQRKKKARSGEGKCPSLRSHYCGDKHCKPQITGVLAPR